MQLPPLEILEPTTLARFHQLLVELGPKVKILAGGTDVVADLKREYDRRLRFPELPSFREGDFPEKLVSIARIQPLKGFLFPRTGAARIGTLATMAELAEDARVAKKLSALADGAASVGSPQVRNRATLGGNLCNARPCADTAPPVIALSATLELEKSGGTKRMVKAAEFFTGPGETVKEREELLVAIHFPRRKRPLGSAFFKLGTRKVYETSLVSAAAAIVVEDERIEEAHIALGSVAPVPIEAERAAAYLEGKKPTERVFDMAGRIAMQEARPISDFRASAEYRARMIQVLTFRALTKAFERFQGKDESERP
ncbi:MAG: FAD binding domain-containing protein [Planctomycetota bacterium]|jgi:carbon-monoxide dehydrogenase medium subunit